MADLIQHYREDRVSVLTINNPERRNALSVEGRQLLLQLLRDALADPDCRGVVLTGAGGHFCAGGEVKPLNADNGPDPRRTRENIAILQDIVRLLAGGPKPTVAAVQGGAFGAGMSLALACDQVLVAPGAKFCASFAKVGLIADAGLMWSLPNRVSTSVAKRLLMTACVVDAEQAVDLGVADTLVQSDALVAAAVRAASDLGQLAPLAIAALKDVLTRGTTSLEGVIAAEADLQPTLTMSQDYLEGRVAFQERRAPNFRGL